MRPVRRIEQILPDLPTRQEVREATDSSIRAAIAPLRTSQEMQEAIGAAVAPLSTKQEMHEAVAAAVAPLATKQDLKEVRDELRTRMEAVAESFRDEVRLIAEATGEVREGEGHHYDEVMERIRRIVAESDGRHADILGELRRQLGREPRPFVEVMIELRQRLAADEKRHAAIDKALDARLREVEAAKPPRKRKAG